MKTLIAATLWFALASFVFADERQTPTLQTQSVLQIISVETPVDDAST